MPTDVDLIIHVGVHKTGSTAIQDAATRNSSLLGEAGVYVPETQHLVNHSHIAQHVFRSDFDVVERWLAEHVAQAERVGATTMLVTGEDFCRVSRSGTRTLNTLLWRYFATVTPVIYLRNKSDYYFSQYKHWLTHGPQTSLAQFSRSANFEPRKVVRRWRDVGHGTCHVHSYDSVLDSAEHFLRIYAGVQLAALPRVNVSLPGFLSLLINTYSKPALGSELDRFTFQLRSRIEGPTWTSFDSRMLHDIAGLFPSEEWIVELDDGSDAAFVERPSRPTELSIDGELHHQLGLLRHFIDLTGEFEGP